MAALFYLTTFLTNLARFAYKTSAHNKPPVCWMSHFSASRRQMVGGAVVQKELPLPLVLRKAPFGIKFPYQATVWTEALSANLQNAYQYCCRSSMASSWVCLL